MDNSTISIKPLPLGTTKEKLEQIFSNFTAKNIHIEGNVGYVHFSDSGDLENLEIQFDNLEVSQLNNAKIDIAQNFNWGLIKKQAEEQRTELGYSSQKHIDLTTADIKNLIVVQNCDPQKLSHLEVEDIKKIFIEFHSINRIVKRKDQVIIQFLDLAQIQLIDREFDNFNISQLGKQSVIEKAENTYLTTNEFTNEWKNANQTSQFSELGYKQNKKSQQVLHHDIIPTLDKKTSMEITFEDLQHKLGYDLEKKEHETIHQADTNHELDFTTQLKIQEELENKLGYEKAQAQRKQQQKKKQQEDQRRIKEQKQRIKNQEQTKRQQQIKQKQLQQRRIEQQRKLKIQQQKKLKQQQQKLRKSEEQRLKRIQQELQVKQKKQEEQRKRRQSEQLDKQLKERLLAQKQKNQRQEKEKSLQSKQSNLGFTGEAPQRVKESYQNGRNEKRMEQQLGYAVNKAKSESASLINAAKQSVINIAKNQSQKLGYETWNVKPDVIIPHPSSGSKKDISKTLITVTLLVWVIYLLFQ